MRSLIVDDNIVNQTLLERFLAGFGSSQCVGNGLDAIRAFIQAWEENRPFDLICLDVSMTGIDGIETLSQLRKIESNRGIVRYRCARIVMITGVGEAATVRRAVTLSDAYLLKPIDKETLLRCLIKLRLINTSPSQAEIVDQVAQLCQRDEFSAEQLLRLQESIQSSLTRRNAAEQAGATESTRGHSLESIASGLCSRARG